MQICCRVAVGGGVVRSACDARHDEGRVPLEDGDAS